MGGGRSNLVMALPEHRVDMVARLTGLLEVTRLVRSEQDLGALLPAIAAAVSDAMGYRTVVISLYRPAWNDFRVETVHGSPEGREALLGRERRWSDWEPLFDLDFESPGCFLLPWDQFDWSFDTSVSFVPDIEMADGPNAWHPEDSLFVPLRHSEGHMLGIMSVDEPISGLRPSDDDLAVLAALAAHAAQAVQDTLAAAEAARHRTALEHLLRVSARLTETLSIDAIMRRSARASAALGFRNVSVELIDVATQRAVPRAVVGWTPAEVAGSPSGDVATLQRLLDREFEVEGCFLLPGHEARARLGIERPAFESARNGHGPLAWNHHWLIIPLHDREGALVGVIWADEPEDRLSLDRPPAGVAQFANQAPRRSRRSRPSRRCSSWPENDALTGGQPPRLHLPPGGGGPSRRALRQRFAPWSSTSTASRRSTTTTATEGDMARGDRRSAARGHARRLRLPPQGDEFALILEDAGVQEATQVVDRVGAGIAGVQAGAGHLLRASFGVAIGDGTPDPEALLQAADAAKYEAKRAGVGVRFAAVNAT